MEALRFPDNSVYGVVEKDAHTKLFASILYIWRTIGEKGCIIRNFDAEMIMTNSAITRDVLLLALRLMCDGRMPELFESTIELASIKAAHSDVVCTQDIYELFLMKYLLKIVYCRLAPREEREQLIYQIISIHSSSTTRNELFPQFNYGR